MAFCMGPRYVMRGFHVPKHVYGMDTPDSTSSAWLTDTARWYAMHGFDMAEASQWYGHAGLLNLPRRGCLYTRWRYVMHGFDMADAICGINTPNCST